MKDFPQRRPPYAPSAAVSSLPKGAPIVPAYQLEVEGVPDRDYLLSIPALEQKAAQGDPSAQYHLGVALIEGYSHSGLNAINKQTGEHWIKRAVEQKNISSAGYCAYAYCFKSPFMGSGIVAQDYESAKRLFVEAAENFMPSNTQLAAILLEEATGKKVTDLFTSDVAIDAEEGANILRLLRKGKDNGYMPAIYLYALCHAKGYGDERNFGEAFRLLQTAADSGYVLAKRDLGRCYERGLGVMENPREARRWYQAASEQGLDVSEDVKSMRKQKGCTIL